MFFIMKILNEKELQQIALNYLCDTGFKDFMNLYKDYNKESFLFLVIHTNLPCDKPLRLKNKLS